MRVTKTPLFSTHPGTGSEAPGTAARRAGTFPRVIGVRSERPFDWVAKASPLSNHRPADPVDSASPDAPTEPADRAVKPQRLSDGGGMGVVAILFALAAGTMWGAMVLRLIKLAYDTLISLLQWQMWPRQ